MSKSLTDFQMTGYTAVGEAVSTHGLDGALKFYPLTDNLKRFKKLKKCFLGEDMKELNLVCASIVKNMAVLRFEEIKTIDEAKPFIGSILYVSDEDRIKLSKDQYFISDLIGCSVYENGESIGEIEDIYSGYANDCYVVRCEENRFMIPAVKEFILSVDIEKRRVDVKLIEGIRE